MFKPFEDPPDHICFKGSQNEKPITEYWTQGGVALVLDVNKKLADVTTPYQRVRVFSHNFFGNILFIDESLQITELDEFYYHELMAHVPMNYNPRGKRVLIIGAGDGGLLTQILKHTNVEQVVQVEIDKVVVQMAKQYFPKIGPAYDSRKLKLIHEPGGEWVHRAMQSGKYNGTFDYIFIDGTDFDSPTQMKFPLYGVPFYTKIQAMMSKRGILTLNADSPSWNLDTIQMVVEMLQSVFKNVHMFNGFQPTFLSGHYSYLMSSDYYHPTHSKIEWKAWSNKNIKTDYYNPDVHYASFLLPSFARDIFKDQLTLEGMMPSQFRFYGKKAIKPKPSDEDGDEEGGDENNDE